MLAEDMPKTSVDSIRIKNINNLPFNPEGTHVLYWMVSARRLTCNFALQHAAETARHLDVGLVVYEPLRSDYPYASARLHRFILQGMADNFVRARSLPLTYYPWVETVRGGGAGLLEKLAEKACLVVTDEFPAFFLPQLLKTAGENLATRLQSVDGNGLLPLQLIDREYPSAYAFRRFLQRALPAFIDDLPQEDPPARMPLPEVVLDDDLLRKWPAADLTVLQRPEGLQALPVDHRIEPVDQVGGSTAAALRLGEFLEADLDGYAVRRNIPDLDCTSRLSAYLHFGHLSAAQVFSALAEREGWTAQCLGAQPSGKRNGWWGMSAAAEAFLDELVTWRELGYGFCARRSDYAEYSGLPEWARVTLERHARDERPQRYDYEDFRQARTHDPLWNAAQRQLLREGRIHGYLRMLWGKKILEWSASPQQAMEMMVDLNDRYALDGRDPNAYNGIGWCLGRFDRPWGPERPIFGKVRYMSSQNTARKVAVKKYLEHYSDEDGC